MTATAAARCLRQKNCRNANKRLSLATLSLSLFYYYKETLSLSLSFCPLRPHGWSWPAAGHAFLLSAAARSHPECFLALHVLPVHWGGDARTVLSWRRRALSALARLVRLVPPALDAARRLRFWFCTCCGNLKKYVSADLPISHVSAAPNLPISQKDSYYHMFGQPECSRCQQSAVEDLRRSKGKTLKSIFVSISKFFFYIVFAWNPSNSPFLISHIHCLNLRLCVAVTTEGV